MSAITGYSPTIWCCSGGDFSMQVISLSYSFTFETTNMVHNLPIGVALEDAQPDNTIQVMTRGTMKLKVKDASSKKQGLTKPTNKEWRSIIDA